MLLLFVMWRERAGGMEHVPGSFGTSASFALRFGQIIFSSASLIFMCLDYDFYDFTTFCYLTTVMAFVTPWSISLALADSYSVLLKQLPHEPRLLSMVLAGDTVMSFLSLGGACGVASATELLSSMGAPICGDNLCSQYQVSATLAFLCWFLLLASALFNLWSLPSLLY
ncbi:hypothetical protein BRARA_I03420 [Brassica rapa]|uniref:CASP-like protein n=4 Tax=Brassica TaxID=3705 RepID=A0A816PDA2_BRANA|nr:CASP-like protein ARALYDRAFT_485429 isoform X1 [Brassica napus]XP_018509755.1 CASP-like protein ARALYDRAFT_485429 isoform X1 [Brassica rapa]RID46778.1 hypothetical protein BRARA_I03420 [Brassica rapa]CAF2046633.1 unnamed protein product [Brassica napus]